MRQYKGVMAIVARSWAVVLGVYCIFYAANVFGLLGLYIADMQNSAILLGLVLAYTFLMIPPSKLADRDALPWYDGVLALGSLVACVYMVFFYTLPPAALNMRLIAANNVEVVLAVFLIVAMFEAGRRSAGLPMVAIAVAFLLYFFFAKYAPGIFQGYSIDLNRAVALLYLSNDGIWGTPMSVAATMIVIFLIFGEFLSQGGGGQFYTKFALALLGHVRGGPAKVAVVASALFGTISGSTSANVATTGVITIPLMKSLGYRAHFAGAVEAVASNGGQIMPPVMGVVAFVMAEWLGIPYWEVAVSSFIPAFLYYFVEFIQVDREAAKMGLVGLPKESLPKLGETLKQGWYFIVPPLLLVLLLAVFGYSPQTAAVYSVGALVVLGFVKRENWNGRWLLRALAGSGRPMAITVPTCAAAGIIIASVILTGMGFKFSSSLVDLAGGNLFFLLLLTAAASFILGMGMVSLVCYIVLVVLVAPALIKLGVLPLAAHLFVFWWGITSFITPPVAIGVFVASGIAGSDSWKTGWQAVRLGIVTFIVPFVFVYNPALLLKGEVTSIIWGVATVMFAGFGIACALSGYIFKPARLVERLVLGAGSALLLIPIWQLAAIGAVVTALPILNQARSAQFRFSFRRKAVVERKE